MNDKIREALDESEFNHKKCGEILVRINDIFFENRCNILEKRFIISTLDSLLTNADILSFIKDDKLHI